MQFGGVRQRHGEDGLALHLAIGRQLRNLPPRFAAAPAFVGVPTIGQFAVAVRAAVQIVHYGSLLTSAPGRTALPAWARPDPSAPSRSRRIETARHSPAH